MIELLLALGAGLGLAAACGFRVFVPLLIAAVAARSGHLPLAGGFTWLSSTPALVALGCATVLELAAYTIPWVDHALDTIATPAAVIAGILASAAVMVDLPPSLRWAVSIIGGGATAGLVQGASVLLRLKSSAFTGGLANPLVALFEAIGGVGVALLAVLLPLVALIAVIALLVVVFRSAGRVVFGRPAVPPLSS
ncbi:MAG: DUF4126 domain-containing protein [Gemmatimonadales bacterium]